MVVNVMVEATEYVPLGKYKALADVEPFNALIAVVMSGPQSYVDVPAKIAACSAGGMKSRMLVSAPTIIEYVTLVKDIFFLRRNM